MWGGQSNYPKGVKGRGGRSASEIWAQNPIWRAPNIWEEEGNERKWEWEENIWRRRNLGVEDKMSWNRAKMAKDLRAPKTVVFTFVDLLQVLKKVVGEFMVRPFGASRNAEFGCGDWRQCWLGAKWPNLANCCSGDGRKRKLSSFWAEGWHN